MKHVIPISGKDSLSVAILMKRLQPDTEFEYIYNFTGKELPETLEWLKSVEKYLQKPILFIGLDMRQTKEWLSGYRPSQGARWCTRKCKIEPTENHYDGEAFVYYGLRADEPERIGYINKGKSELTPVYPLREHGYDISKVLQLVNEVGLKPPTFRWEYLVDRYTKIFGQMFLNKRFAEWELDQLYAWRKRNNCYDCFFMMMIEWVGLAEHHPDLFWAHVEEEENPLDRTKPFYTIQNYPLRRLYADRWQIADRYVLKTAKKIWQLKQNKLFTNESIFTDTMASTSCGLLCGK